MKKLLALLIISPMLLLGCTTPDSDETMMEKDDAPVMEEKRDEVMMEKTEDQTTVEGTVNVEGGVMMDTTTQE